MNQDQCGKTTGLITKFSPVEKIYFRAAFFGFVLLGIFELYRMDPFWAYVYIAVCVVGLNILNLALCVHCPYPSKHESCVFMPYQFVRKFFPYKGPKMSLLKKVSWPLAMLVMMAFPVYWLTNNWWVLTPFIACCLAVALGFVGHLCRHCQHVDCPANLVGIELKKQLAEEAGLKI